MGSKHHQICILQMLLLNRDKLNTYRTNEMQILRAFTNKKVTYKEKESKFKTSKLKEYVLRESMKKIILPLGKFQICSMSK